MNPKSVDIKKKREIIKTKIDEAKKDINKILTMDEIDIQEEELFHGKINKVSVIVNNLKKVRDEYFD